MHFRSFRPSLPLACLAILLVALLLAGGSSRADAAGQVAVRGAAWVLVVVALLFGPKPHMHAARPVAWLLCAALALALVQLVPLPPAIWQALPGREPFAEAGRLIGTGQPWRSISLVPGATFNAAGALVVPLAVLLFMTTMKDVERRWVLTLVLGMIVLAVLVGMLQFAGSLSGSFLLRDRDMQVSGIFSNRNHFALLLALGCLVAPAWAVLDPRRFPFRGVIAGGLVLLFLVTILAIGSRAGLGLVLPALVIGLLLARTPLQRALKRAPRWVMPALAIGTIVLIGTLVLLSMATDRAAAIDRIFAADLGQDMRSRGLPTVLAMMWEYFPVGAGIGSFDPVFRLHEPFHLLKPTYFNHAHNDFLEIVLDAGLAGLLLVMAALTWWILASVRAWRMNPGTDRLLPRLGSAVLLCVVVASIFDYPARTPTIMALAVIAAVWLSERPAPRVTSL